MDFKQALLELEKSLSRKNIIVLFCNCEVEYAGRAKSFLAQGDRLILIKHDNTVLVHKPNGRNPTNWMPPNSIILPEIDDEILKINVSNLKPKENMNINVYEIYSMESSSLVDTEQLKLVGTEKDMSDMIYENPELISNEFIPINREEQTEYGFLDVFGHDGKGNFVIIECKRYTAGLSSVTQLRRYVERVKKSKGIDCVKGILVAPNITNNALKMLTNWGFEFKKITLSFKLQEDSEKQLQIKEFLL